ncbi:MAG: SDR family NAD(P)-dependent oxidoreductase [Flavipsychrobacter sp.]|nr:SDR family NAD(P)-dependent oxidoreductase [Flavipsychrobacter sp.]
MTGRNYVLITGASSGLGREFAIKCAQRGMNVLLFALPGGNTQSLAHELRLAFGVDAQAIELDMTDSAELISTVNTIAERYPIQFLINNAGVGGTSSILQTSWERIDNIIQLNVRSTTLITRILIPHLMKHAQSYIMNISSMAAFSPIAYKTVYPASKAFISSFSLSLREELAGTGVSVSVVYPGPIMTNSYTARRIIAQGLKGKMGLLPTSSIAAIALAGTLGRQPTIVPGFMNKLNHLLMALLPGTWRLKIISRAVKKEISFSVTA